MSTVNSNLRTSRTGLVVFFLLDGMQKSYRSKEVSGALRIGQSTLRKWCIELEKNGYTFEKGAMDSRVFIDQDLAVLNYFKQLLKDKTYKRDQVAKFVVERFKIKGEPERSLPMEDTRSIEKLLKQMLDNQEKLLKRLESIESEIKNISSDRK